MDLKINKLFLKKIGERPGERQVKFWNCIDADQVLPKFGRGRQWKSEDICKPEVLG